MSSRIAATIQHKSTSYQLFLLLIHAGYNEAFIYR